MEKDSRDKLIEAATELFASKGFAAVSIREVSQQAGVNSALISYHFGGKEGLYTAVLETQLSVLLQLAEKMQMEKLDPIERIRQYAYAVLNMHKHSPSLIRFFYSELFSPTACFQKIIQNILDKMYKMLCATIQAGITAGQFRADLKAEQAAIALVGIMNFYFISRPINSQLLPPEACPEEYVEQALGIYLNGIVRRSDNG